MNKKTLIAGAVGIALVGAVGGNIVAGKKLESAYHNSFDVQDKRFKVNVSEFNMGMLSGSAKWTGEITADLCHPEYRPVFRSEDTITRGLTGYTVVSKIYAQNPDSPKETHLFDIRSQTTWSGNIDSEITIPANSFTENSSTLTWEPITAAFTLKNGKDGREVHNLKINIPGITLKDPKFNGAIKNASYQADRLTFAMLAAGKAGGKVESVTFSMAGSNPFEMSLNNLESSADVAIHNGKLVYTSSSKLGDFSLQGNPQQHVKLEQIRYNLSMKDLDAKAFEILADLFKAQSQRCVPAAESEKAFQEFLKALLQSGGAFESKDNQIVLNGSKATMQWESSFPANVVSEKMTDEQAQELLKQTKAQGEVRIDKKFIREGYKAFMNISGTPVDDAQLEQAVQSFEKGILELNNSEFKDAVQAKADGGQLVITLTKEAGKLPASLEKTMRDKARAASEMAQ